MKPIRIICRQSSSGLLRLVVSSASDARRRYVVTKKKRWACSCRIWIFRRGYLRRLLEHGKINKTQFAFQVKNFHCKHIKAVL